MKNCNVSHSKESGLGVYNGGLMTIDGNATTIHHNCIDGNCWNFGLYVDSSSSVHLFSPLTKEMISTNNHGGKNHGGPGTICAMALHQNSHDSDSDSSDSDVLDPDC